MIKIIDNIGLLNICNNCNTDKNTKSIAITNGIGANLLVCLCDKCRKELVKEITNYDNLQGHTN